MNDHGLPSNCGERKRLRNGFILCGVALSLAVIYSSRPAISIALFVVVGACFYGFQPCFWAVPTLFLSESAAAASIGLINSVGNLGGFAGPFAIGYLANRTHSF